MPKKLLLFGVAALVAVGLFLPGARTTARLVVLDVGQGDALYVRTPAGNDILIDTGPGYSVVNQLREQMPSGDTTIELLILTHLDADHSGGTSHVLDNYKFEVFATNGAAPTTQTGRAALEAGSKAQKVIELSRGQRISADGFRMDALWPISAGTPEKNDGSIVLRLLTNKSSVLLTGDIPSSVERQLVADMQWVRADVLKIAHHGSAGSSDQIFLRATNAHTATISSGANNRYGHPKQETLDRLQQEGLVVERTDLTGAITIPL